MDGVVTEGSSTIDESVVTGEPVPVAKHPGERLIGATLNGTGGLLMRAERVGSETLLAQILGMVGEAQRSRAPIQRLADIVGGWFVPAVVLVSLATLVVWGCGQAMPVPQIPCPLPLPDADSCPLGADTKRNRIETTPGVARDLQIFEYLLSFR